MCYLIITEKKQTKKTKNGGFKKMRKAAQAKAAEDFVNAIKTIANKPENLDNLESYLSYHFCCMVGEIRKYAR